MNRVETAGHATRVAAAPVTVERTRMLGIPVDCIDVPALHDFIENTIDANERAQILNINVNCVNLALSRPWLQDMLNDAPVVFCDGAGVQLGARILGRPVPPKLPYNTWMWELAPFAAERGYSLFLLGAKPGVADRAAAALVSHTPGLRIAGTAHGYFDQTPGSDDTKRVVKEINDADTQILVMALGMPAQERWLRDNWDDLNVNIGLNGGAVLDYLCGDLNMPPKWVAEHGLEWAHRLTMEPRRMWRRYLVGNPQFLARIVKERISGST